MVLYGTVCSFGIPYLFNSRNYVFESCGIIGMYIKETNFISPAIVVDGTILGAKIHAVLLVVFSTTCATGFFH